MKKQNEISRIPKNLSKNNLAKIFNVYTTRVEGRQQYYYNINRGFTFTGLDNIPNSYYNEYQIVQEDTWSLISWKHLGTIELWWVICLFNRIYDPMREPDVGKYIRVPDEKIVNMIREELENAD